MDLEKVALEAVKEKIQEIFDKISVNAEMEGKDIVIRIKMPDEIMNNIDKYATDPITRFPIAQGHKDLDKEAQAAAKELLGNQEFIKGD